MGIAEFASALRKREPQALRLSAAAKLMILISGSNRFVNHILLRRTLILISLLGAEALVASILLDGDSLLRQPYLLPRIIGEYGAWSVKGSIGFVAFFATFAFLRYRTALLAVAAQITSTRLRPVLLIAHGAAIALFAVFSDFLYWGRTTPLPMNLVAALWIATGLGGICFAMAAVAPFAVWRKLAVATRNLFLVSAGASLCACLAGATSWRLWDSTSRVTFRLVSFFLRLCLSDVVIQPAAMRIGTHRFTAIISPQCSGLEGAALIMVFGLIWLILFRDDIRFPQAFLLVPAGMVALFLLNSIRITALILIGNAGARDIASRGFHSQAGWIAFNLVALAFSVLARRLRWFSKIPRETRDAAEPAIEYRAAAWLGPFLAIMAASMVAGALSPGFEWLYPLRLFAGLATLWAFRNKYSQVDWRFGWLGLAGGVAVFVFWVASDWLTRGRQGDAAPAALLAAPAFARGVWITCRVAAAVVTVPIAEELAFRGYLMRRLVSSRFDGVPWSAITLLSVAFSSLIFGLLHGRNWLAATLAGLVYALVAIRTRRLGEAVAAHATTNLLLAGWVLFLQKWSVW